MIGNAKGGLLSRTVEDQRPELMLEVGFQLREFEPKHLGMAVKDSELARPAATASSALAACSARE